MKQGELRVGRESELLEKRMDVKLVVELDDKLKQLQQMIGGLGDINYSC